MNKELQLRFERNWEKYFPGADLPIAWFYTDHVSEEDLKESRTYLRCLIGNLERVIKGYTFIYDAKSPGCLGGKRYSGYSQKLRKNFEYFLSCGIEGEMEGERYKKNPELVSEQLQHQQPFTAPGKFLVFKRLDKLSENEEPSAVVFFATPDVLSGLFTLANFDSPEPNAVVTPFGSGCAAIIEYPLEESLSDNPKCYLGMFDVSARPYVPKNTLSFTVPMKKFETMTNNMDESFLITNSWKIVKERL